MPANKEFQKETRKNEFEIACKMLLLSIGAPLLLDIFLCILGWLDNPDSDSGFIEGFITLWAAFMGWLTVAELLVIFLHIPSFHNVGLGILLHYGTVFPGLYISEHYILDKDIYAYLLPFAVSALVCCLLWFTSIRSKVKKEREKELQEWTHKKEREAYLSHLRSKGLTQDYIISKFDWKHNYSSSDSRWHEEDMASLVQKVLEHRGTKKDIQEFNIACDILAEEQQLTQEDAERWKLTLLLALGIKPDAGKTASAESGSVKAAPVSRTTLSGNIYVPFIPGLQKPWPVVSTSGDICIYAFTDESEAFSYAGQHGFGVINMTPADYQRNIPLWRRAGIDSIELHKDGTVQKDQLPGEPVYNGDLKGLMIRYEEIFEKNTENPDSPAAENCRNMLWQRIPERLFFVAIGFEGENISTPVSDHTLRLLPGAAMELIKRRTKNGNIDTFDGYPFAKTADGRAMHLMVLGNQNTGVPVVGAFTDPQEFEAVWNGRAHIALATFDDLKDRYAPTAGILINPANQCFILEPSTIEEIDRNRSSKV